MLPLPSCILLSKIENLLIGKSNFSWGSQLVYQQLVRSYTTNTHPPSHSPSKTFIHWQYTSSNIKNLHPLTVHLQQQLHYQHPLTHPLPHSPSRTFIHWQYTSSNSYTTNTHSPIHSHIPHHCIKNLHPLTVHLHNSYTTNTHSPIHSHIPHQEPSSADSTPPATSRTSIHWQYPSTNSYTTNTHSHIPHQEPSSTDSRPKRLLRSQEAITVSPGWPPSNETLSLTPRLSDAATLFFFFLLALLQHFFPWHNRCSSTPCPASWMTWEQSDSNSAANADPFTSISARNKSGLLRTCSSWMMV